MCTVKFSYRSLDKLWFAFFVFSEHESDGRSFYSEHTGMIV